MERINQPLDFMGVKIQVTYTMSRQAHPADDFPFFLFSEKRLASRKQVKVGWTYVPKQYFFHFY